MTIDRITSIEVEGMRSISRLRLDLDGIRVLIGESGSGKSTLIEALAILRSLPEGDFMRTLHSVHGGPHALVDSRAGGRLRLAVSLSAGPGAKGEGLEYELILSGASGTFAIERESLASTRHAGDSGQVMERVGNSYRSPVHGTRKGQAADISGDALALASLARSDGKHARRMIEALEGIEVHVPFDAMAAWAAKRAGRNHPSFRSSRVLEPARSLALSGENLASVYHAMKNSPTDVSWPEVLDVLRLGLGASLEDVSIRVEAGSTVQLLLKHHGTAEVPAVSLSDGALNYLAFTALRFLPSRRSLLAIDEPELHLHPHLVFRVLDILTDMATRHPVLIATHSDRLLDGLEKPAKSIRLLELDEERSTRMRTPDGPALAQWLQRYSGVGAIRQAGLENVIFKHRSSPAGRP